MELGLPWVFPTLPFYLASIEVEELPEVCASGEACKKLSDFQLSALPLGASQNTPETSTSTQ